MTKQIAFFVKMSAIVNVWKAMAGYAQDIKDMLGMLAMAQVAIETGWLQAPIGNNLSGIKGHIAKYGYVVRETAEVINGETVHEAGEFQVYPSTAAWLADYIGVQTSHVAVMNAIPFGWEACCVALGPLTDDDKARMAAHPPLPPLHSEYSSSPTYPGVMKEIIAENRLFDPLVLAWYASGANPANRPPGG